MKLRTKDGKFIGRIVRMEVSSSREMAQIYNSGITDNTEGDITFPHYSIAGRITLWGNPSSELIDKDMTDDWCLWMRDVLITDNCGAMFKGYSPTLEQLKNNSEFTF